MKTAKQSARVYGLGAIKIKTCATCGNRFAILTEDYGYKLSADDYEKRYDYYCSYHCMREKQKPLEEAQKRRFAKKVALDNLRLELEEERQKAMQEKANASLTGRKLDEKENERISSMISRMKRKGEKRHDL